jgi:hypothetical protein
VRETKTGEEDGWMEGGWVGGIEREGGREGRREGDKDRDEDRDRVCTDLAVLAAAKSFANNLLRASPICSSPKLI